ncbi:hypothetical protein CYK57_01166 [Actinobacillus pleuropneumoniae]|uniref:Uncharacterized protein n=2 Tax=Actinobacillus pleuropneumoniae TaxID=715 RepID=A0A223MHG9_ACTPL|nr:hypothetical protein [Actinobacillus pleuropneumoniae]EFM96427.1 hypothetical protein appser10_10380 [Actinobacillus pleuropneumoniae serovar 10 str. D13039]EFM98540.1 hypothetical protein appser11_11110 [Actinobacillus pleuropneumoniae serovar 11 str. 56153]ASU17008.1 hypothetical protein CHY23_02273 [Actinobacillus pleuropneumoniae]EFM87675.1 hypothetical protein appser2_9700 [Actinobacillus pleuropneumoniae serovar 2 str. S1536]EFM91894.1 hypothetical protein appser6_11430 [Actinobacillu
MLKPALSKFATVLQNFSQIQPLVAHARQAVRGYDHQPSIE